MSHLKSKKEQLIARVRRIAGQMGAIEKAIEQDADCSAVLHQVAGARGAIAGLMDGLIEDHVREHVSKPGIKDAARTAAAEDLIAIVRRYTR